VHIRNDLRALVSEDYTRTLHAYIDAVAQAPGVLAVFQFGQVGHPGVSDLDLLVVVRDDIPVASLRAVIDASRGDDISRYLFSHPPVVIPLSCAPHAAYLHSLYHLRHVWGEPTAINVPAPAERDRLMPAEYIDFTFAVRGVLRALQGTVTGLRGLLQLLKSCAHSLRLASAITGRPLEAGIPDHVARLCDLGLDRRTSVPPETCTVVRDCLQALREADRWVEAQLHARGLVRSAAMTQCIAYVDGRYYLFETPLQMNGDARSPGGLLRSRWWKALGVDASVERYPGCYLAQFATYGSGHGTYARVHRAVFGHRAGALLLDPGYREILLMRCRLVERVYGVVGRAGLIPMVPLGIGFRAPDRIRLSRKRRLLRPLVASQRSVGRV
jgi:hypothetical protein